MHNNLMSNTLNPLSSALTEFVIRGCLLFRGPEGYRILREGYGIPDTSNGRGTEFLTPLTGGVQNSWHVSSEKFLDIFQGILYCPSLHSLLVVIIDKIFFIATRFLPGFGRGTEFPTRQLGGVQNSWRLKWEGYKILDRSIGEFYTPGSPK